MTKTTTIELELNDNNLLIALYGIQNAHLHHLENKLNIELSSRGNRLQISGLNKDVKKAQKIIQTLWRRLEDGSDIHINDIDTELRFLQNPEKKKKVKKRMSGKDIVIKTKKKSISPRSPNQAKYLQAMQTHEMVFGLGPAGTGKTYLAVAMAVSKYLAGDVERMIFCRPAVEAGENLGFLPGDMKDKVDPYLRPIYDALQDMLPMEQILKNIESGEIEIAPLAFMRGRTLSNAFVVLDEAQNTTCTQMKMILTRMGEASHLIVTGDITQTDLPVGVKSGLRDALEILEHVDDIAFHHFTKEDVTRHPLVERIIGAYDQKNS